MYVCVCLCVVVTVYHRYLDTILVPLFQFTETSYSVMENMGPATAAIELVDRQLTFNIVVNVLDVTGGTASGKTQYVWNCLCVCKKQIVYNLLNY